MTTSTNGGPAEPKDLWSEKNRRRVFLINKEEDKGLSEREKKELQQLQEELDRHLDQVAPLPFEALDQFKKVVNRRRAKKSKHGPKGIGR